MNGPRGKRRAVVEVLASDGWRGGHRGTYSLTLRLECGHVVKATGHGHYKPSDPPTIGYCIECSALDVEAA